jgi:uncharacterized cupin superfamily protein
MSEVASGEVISFEGAAAEPSAPPPDRLLDGDPRQLVQIVYSDPSGQFFVGRWRSTRGRWRVAYREHEFCHLLSGRVRLVSASGTERSFGPGASLVVPAGFAGSWEVLEDCEKLYAIFEPTGS